MTGLAYTMVAACALLCACGGKAVIDAESGSGAGGSTSNTMTTGGTGGVPSTGGGGAGGDAGCAVSGFIDVINDGADQRYQAAGPDPFENVPTANLVYGEGASSLEVRGCASNSSTNSCIRLSGLGIDGDGQVTDDTRVEYTSANGIVFIGDSVYMDLVELGPVGTGKAYGTFEGDVLASGGADQRYLFGEFDVCRSPDVAAP